MYYALGLKVVMLLLWYVLFVCGNVCNLYRLWLVTAITHIHIHATFIFDLVDQKLAYISYDSTF